MCVFVYLSVCLSVFVCVVNVRIVKSFTFVCLLLVSRSFSSLLWRVQQTTTRSAIFLFGDSVTVNILNLIAFITGNSSLEPLLEGLFAQIHVNLSWRVFGRNRTRDLRITRSFKCRVLHHWATVTDKSLIFFRTLSYYSSAHRIWGLPKTVEHNVFRSRSKRGRRRRGERLQREAQWASTPLEHGRCLSGFLPRAPHTGTLGVEGSYICICMYKRSQWAGQRDFII